MMESLLHLCSSPIVCSLCANEIKKKSEYDASQVGIGDELCSTGPNEVERGSNKSVPKFRNQIFRDAYMNSEISTTEITFNFIEWDVENRRPRSDIRRNEFEQKFCLRNLWFVDVHIPSL